MPRREISLDREIAPIIGETHRIRTFHHRLKHRLDTVVTITLPVIFTGAPVEAIEIVAEIKL